MFAEVYSYNVKEDERLEARDVYGIGRKERSEGQCIVWVCGVLWYCDVAELSSLPLIV